MAKMKTEIKSVTCTICGNSISKRKSIMIDKGRVCRSHQEVNDYFNKIKEDELTKRADKKMQIIMAVSFVRIYHSIRNIPVWVLKKHVQNRLDHDSYKEFEKELNVQGDKMTAAEIISIFASLFSPTSVMNQFIDNNNKKLNEITKDEIENKNA